MKTNFKTCSKCKIRQPKSEFNKGAKYSDGLDCHCRTCKKRYYQNLDRKTLTLQHQKRMQKRFRDPIEKRKIRLLKLLQSAKRRAKIRGLSYNLTFAWIDEHTKTSCPVFGIPFVFGNLNSKFSFEAPSIDRVNNKLGYTQSNCIIVSRKANTIKSFATDDELWKIAKFYKKLNR